MPEPGEPERWLIARFQRVEKILASGIRTPADRRVLEDVTSHYGQQAMIGFREDKLSDWTSSWNWWPYDDRATDEGVLRQHP